jgi:molybdate transport system substrate-binding protein
MVKINKILSAVFLPLMFFCSVASAKTPTAPINLTIFAEPNMTYALTEIARSYSNNRNAVISINFNSSFELIQNIDFGEPADIFISSHPFWIETLKQKGLVDVYNLSNIAKDQLVLITSVKNKKITNDIVKDADPISETLREISNIKIPLIIGSDYSSLGRYTSQLVKEANIKDQYLYRKVNEDKKSIIDFIRDNNDYCGIVLASEVKNQNDIRILRIIPEIDIFYQGLVIAGDNMEKARDFLKYMKSDESKKLLTKNGFIVDK